MGNDSETGAKKLFADSARRAYIRENLPPARPKISGVPDEALRSIAERRARSRRVGTAVGHAGESEARAEGDVPTVDGRLRRQRRRAFHRVEELRARLGAFAEVAGGRPQRVLVLAHAVALGEA